MICEIKGDVFLSIFSVCNQAQLNILSERHLSYCILYGNKTKHPIVNNISTYNNTSLFRGLEQYD